MQDIGAIWRPSPNFGDRPAGGPVDMLVLHYTGMQSAGAALDRLCDPVAQVSAHYLIDEDGTIYLMVEEPHRAWHAGKSSWRGHQDVNDRSIGIELVNPGHEFGYRPFPPPQMAALAGLAAGIVTRWPIPPRNVVGHSDVAPHRKQDPGEFFDWQWLAARGIGLWPLIANQGASDGARDGADDPAALLALFGYGVEPGGDLAPLLTAFQRHFRPSRCDGKADDETMALLSRLVRLI